jgi:hypothetical protein
MASLSSLEVEKLKRREMAVITFPMQKLIFFGNPERTLFCGRREYTTNILHICCCWPTGERLESNANPLLSWSYGSFMFTMYFKQIHTIHNLEHTRHIIVKGMLYDNFNQMHMKVMYLAFFLPV